MAIAACSLSPRSRVRAGSGRRHSPCPGVHRGWRAAAAEPCQAFHRGKHQCFI